MKLNSRWLFPSLFTGTLALGLIGVAGLAPSVRAQDPAPAAKANTLPADEDKAWAEVQAATKPPATPPEWRTTAPTTEERMAFITKQADLLSAGADKAGEFLARFPKSTHAAAARKLEIDSLNFAVMLGKKDRQADFDKLLTAAAADTSLPEDDRLNYRIQKLSRGMTLSGTGSQAGAREAYTDGLIALQKDFPKSDKLYSMLTSMALNEKGAMRDRLAKAVASSPDAPEKLKKKAQDILDGKIFDAAKQVGKPVQIKFTAVDGREVDLAKLKGKVVLIDFWATWCGPCVAEVPHVVEAYNKYHEKGFEIVGISFDQEGDKGKLTQFTKDKGMPWPQYFDGKFWENDFGQQFNIQSIPTMWLIGKDGNLATDNGRADLAGQVGKLLEAN